MRFLILLLLLPTSLSIGSEEWREKIVIIDTGLDSMDHIELCRGEHKDFTGTGLRDNLEHGTSVFKLVTENFNVGKHCVVIVKWTDTRKQKGVQNYFEKIMKYVSSLNPSFVNMSISGSDFSDREKDFIKDMTEKGTKFFVAAGNDSQNLGRICSIFPACYKLEIESNFNVVGALDENGERLRSSNFGGPVNEYELGIYKDHGRTFEGTSFASPRALNKELMR